jgi:hypothetical protein
MANLLDLPNEIIFKILSIVASECPKFFLRSLSISSRRFSLLLRPLIIRRLRFCLDSDRHLAKYALLMRTLDENPELKSMVHSVTLCWIQPDEDIYEKTNKMLENVPKLRSLDIHVGGAGSGHRYPSSLNHMPDLREIMISEPRLMLEDLQKYMVLTHAEHIIIQSRLTRSSSISKDIIKRTSPVLTLGLEPPNHISPETLRDILEWCPKIEALRCALPGHGFVSYTSPTRMDTSLSPMALSQALAPARDSLRELEFHVCSCHWPGQANSRMDLSMMRVLKYISCPAECFFSPNAVYVARIGLYKLLPAGLEELTVSK